MKQENKVLAYIRVSTDKQNLKNQKHKILEYAHNNKIIVDEFIEIEISSKKNQNDRKLNILFEKLNNGDTLICTELSRLGRNMLEILNLIQKFTEQNIKLIFTNQPELSTNQNNALSSLLLAIYGYFAQTEREIISERTKQGLANAKANGKTLGRPKNSTSKSKLDDKIEEIKGLLKLNINKTSISKLVGCDRTTLTSFIKSRKLV